MVERRSFPKGAILCVIALSMLLSPAMGYGATIDVYPGQKIQDAVNSASAGDTIILHAGTYTENIEVKKQLTMQAQASGQVTVTAKHGGTPCIIIKKDGSRSTIQGFILSDATSDAQNLIKGETGRSISPTAHTTNHQEEGGDMCGRAY